MTHLHPASASIGALTSPVNAPFGSGWTFCAASSTGAEQSWRATSSHSGSARGMTSSGGAMTVRTLGTCAAARATWMASSTPEAPPWCIFQLPAMSGLRWGFMEGHL